MVNRRTLQLVALAVGLAQPALADPPIGFVHVPGGRPARDDGGGPGRWAEPALEGVARDARPRGRGFRRGPPGRDGLAGRPPAPLARLAAGRGLSPGLRRHGDHRRRRAARSPRLARLDRPGSGRLAPLRRGRPARDRRTRGGRRPRAHSGHPAAHDQRPDLSPRGRGPLDLPALGRPGADRPRRRRPAGRAARPLARSARPRRPAACRSRAPPPAAMRGWPLSPRAMGPTRSRSTT